MARRQVVLAEDQKKGNPYIVLYSFDDGGSWRIEMKLEHGAHSHYPLLERSDPFTYAASPEVAIRDFSGTPGKVFRVIDPTYGNVYDFVVEQRKVREVVA